MTPPVIQGSVALLCLEADGMIAMLLAAAAQAGAALMDPIWRSGDAFATLPPADVTMIATEALDTSALLIVAEARKAGSGRLILIAPDMSTDQRILVRSLGADHVLTAPVDPREVTALLVTIFRAVQSGRPRLRSGEQGHRWRLAVEGWTLIAPNNRAVRLSRAEHAVLGLLFRRPGGTVPRSILVAAMNGEAGRSGERGLDVLLSRLRRKVIDTTGLGLPLRAARNAGYLFAGIVADGAAHDDIAEARHASGPMTVSGQATTASRH